MIDEGYTKFRAVWSPTATLDFPELAPLCTWRTRLHDAGLIGEYAEHGIGFGNLSARINGGDAFIISGTQTGQQRASSPHQFALVTRVDAKSNTVECEGPVQASSESMTHAAVYATDRTVHSVVHVHDAELWQYAIENLPVIPPDVAYGTPQMAAAFAALMANRENRRTGIVAMAGHEEGLIAVGRSVEDASRRLLRLKASVTGHVADT